MEKPPVQDNDTMFETSSSHLSAGSTEGPPPGVALLSRSHVLVHVFLQQTAAGLASRRKASEASSSGGGAFTHLSELVGDVLPCFSAPLRDLPFKLLVEGRKHAAVSVDSQVTSVTSLISWSTHLQVDGGGDPQVEADVHLCWDDVVGHASLDHGHIDGGDVAEREALAGVQPEIWT